MTLKTFLFTFSFLPAITLAGGMPFDGNYSASVGPGPLKDLYILSVAGNSGTMTFAKVFQKPEPSRPVAIEQTAKKMTVIPAEIDHRLVFEKSEKGLTCTSGCSVYAARWEEIKKVEQAKPRPADNVDFDSLPAAELGNIDGAWIQSKGDPKSVNDTAYEVKGGAVKRYYFTYGLYPKSSIPDDFLVSGESFISPRSGGTILKLRKLSDTQLIARSPQWKGQVFLYRADSIKFVDLKRARDAAGF
ncbi:hypothetical protein [Pseudomonas marginalis]|uniref:hypothetical protein n=1 Tax=Pseudomonas marginalis TaxID=298 RepID=UPI0005FBD944|nr:hypothetical protein [Pseudomonas marginalis]KJZ52488.1 hypothetical protein VC36_28410 [Pseudomonas marginalis]KJZ57114.1 hypothetical protein VC37_05530 [Pseudomonas marginalis]